MAEEDPISINISVRFRGPSAASNKIDGYDGSESIYGFSKALLISGHFLASGKVTFQAPAAKGVKIYLLPAKEGSFDQLVQFVLENKEFFLGAGAAATKDLIKDGLKYIFSKACGLTILGARTAFKKLVGSQNKDGDVDALIEAVEGPLRSAHRTINVSADKIDIRIDGERIVRLNARSKRYLSERRTTDETEELIVSVSSYNVNNKTGRIYDQSLGRTVPFSIHKDVSKRTLRPLSWSLDQRNVGLPGLIKVTVARVITINDETKKYILHQCNFIRRT